MGDDPCILGDDAPAPRAGGQGPVSSAIFRVARAHKSLAGALLSELGLYPGQEIVLMLLGDAGPTEQRELVRSLGKHPSTLTKMFQRLEQSGMIRRTRSTADQRAMVVELTDTGRQLIPRLHEMWGELERLTLAGLPPDGQAELAAVLAGLERSIRDGLHRFRPAEGGS